MLHWSGRTVDELFEYVRKGMPEDAASQVSDADKLDILAFIFEKNGFPAGERPLTAEGLSGARILIEEKNGPTPPPTGATVRTVGCVTREGSGWILREATDPVRTTVDPAAAQPEATLTQSGAGTATFQLIGGVRSRSASEPARRRRRTDDSLAEGGQPQRPAPDAGRVRLSRVRRVVDIRPLKVVDSLLPVAQSAVS